MVLLEATSSSAWLRVINRGTAYGEILRAQVRHCAGECPVFDSLRMSDDGAHETLSKVPCDMTVQRPYAGNVH